MLTCIRYTLTHTGASKLIKYCDQYESLGVNVWPNEDLMDHIRELDRIDEYLVREELENLGLSKTARELRKDWRQCCKAIKRTMQARIKASKLYRREWAKPKQVYISKRTGECHNGLYWTLRACLSCPTLIKYGFVRGANES